MKIEQLKILFSAALLLTMQVLVFNHIHLFGCAIPLLYIYVVLGFPRNFPRWSSLIWAFVIGLIADTSINTQGVAAASMTLMAFIQPYILEIFMNRDSDDDFKPTMSNMGFLDYAIYSLIIVLVYCTLFFTLETFSFFDWQQWLMLIGGSTAITLAFIWVIEKVKK
jgi:rod shape-determining protein MreD